MENHKSYNRVEEINFEISQIKNCIRTRTDLTKIEILTLEYKIECLNEEKSKLIWADLKKIKY